MTVTFPFSIGDIVYLKTDTEQKERMIIQITINTNGLQYNLACGELESTWHFEIEFSKERNELIRL